jgi:hypothetical protein
MKGKMATEQMRTEEHAAETMPAVADAVYRAASQLAALVGPHFYGETTIKWEDGKPVYFRRHDGFKL